MAGSDSEEDDDLAHLFADTAMLRDVDRNDRYAAAIKAKVTAAGSDALVLDIGAGTGLLAMLAARAGAGQVVACEIYEPMAAVGKACLAANAMDDRVRLEACSSTELRVGEQLQRRAGVLLSEIVDSQLLGEGMLPSLRHAMRELVEPDAAIVPEGATVWAQLVECEELWRWESLAHEQWAGVGAGCPGSGALHDVHLNRLGDRLRPLSDPVAALHFDLRHPPPVEGGCTTVNFRPHTLGTVHAIVMWWNLELAPGNLITTAPAWIDSATPSPWREHWMECVQVLPSAGSVAPGEAMSVCTTHDDYGICFELVPGDGTSPESTSRGSLLHCTCGVHSRLDRCRLAQLNDPLRQANIGAALCAAAAALPSSNPPQALGFDHAVAFHASGAVSRTVLLDGYAGTRQVMEQLINDKPGISLVEDLDGVDGGFNLVIVEPSFGGLEPWQGLSAVSAVASALPWLAPSAIVVPAALRILACVIECDQLHNLCQPVQEIDSLDLRPYDVAVVDASGDTLETTQALWELDHRRLSPCVTVWQGDLLGLARAAAVEGTIAPQQLTTEISVQHAGRAHALVVWLEGADGNQPAGSTLNCTYTRQLTHTFTTERHVNAEDVIALSMTVDAATANVALTHCQWAEGASD